MRLPCGVPCYQTFHKLLNSLNEEIVAEKFMTWMKSYHPEIADTYVALDGKAVRSSVKAANTSAQNFSSIVSAFGHSSGLVYGMVSFENKKSGEIQALKDLVSKLGLTDKVYTMDALHTKKNT